MVSFVTDGLVVATIDTDLFIVPAILGVNSIGISPVPPGGMGSLGHPLGTVHPQDGFTS
jgi:hypothetical protein